MTILHFQIQLLFQINSCIDHRIFQTYEYHRINPRKIIIDKYQHYIRNITTIKHINKKIYDLMDRYKFSFDTEKRTNIDTNMIVLSLYLQR